ncbi:MAG: DUF3108 domain-containing protein [Methylotenera sp.]|nr:DUF3108 domain-containing protein [Methylotenera sp.]
MWISANLIGLKSVWKNACVRHLLLALGLSLLLHLFLIGTFNFNLSEVNEPQHVIEARLALPKAELAKPIVKDLAPSELPPKPEPVKQASSPPVTPVTDTSVQSEPSDTYLYSDAIPMSEQVSPIDSDVVTEPAVMDTEINADEVGLIINPNAYQYVETEFDVRTDISAKIDSSPAGNAKMVYQLLPNGEQYRITSLIQAKGLAALIIPDLLQTSDGFLHSTGLQPQHYRYQFGDKKNKTYSADFDWENKKLILHSAKGDQTLELTEGTQDLLSFMYQFMFVPPLQNMKLSITNGRKLGIYDYSFEGEEIIATKMGDLNTIHLLRMADEGEKKTELWLALDYQYVPVKIRETDKDGKVYDLLVTSLKIQQPENIQ